MAVKKALWARAYSKARASEYDARLMRVAGGRPYHDMLSCVLEALPIDPRRPTDVLELGVGTGRLSARVLRRFRLCRLWGVDGSPAMLEKASASLRRFGDRARLLGADFGAPGALRDIGPFDAVVSTAAVHHLSDPGKAALFSRLWKKLKAGGAVVIGDPVRPEDGRVRGLNDAVWARAIAKRLRRGFGERKDAASILRWIDETRRAEGDRPTSLEKQLGWLRRAGFEQVDCHWKHFGFAVFGGVKPASARRNGR